MIEKELPDGTVAQFPDGTPEHVMEKAMADFMAKATPNKKNMYSKEQFIAAARKAHEAGNGDDAKRLLEMARDAEDYSQPQIPDGMFLNPITNQITSRELMKNNMDEPSNLSSAIKGGAQGMLWGLGDEVAGVGGYLRGGKDEARYKKELMRSILEKSRETNPVMHTGGEIAGAIGTAVPAGVGGVTAKGGSLGMTALKSMGKSAAGGAVYSFNDGEGGFGSRMKSGAQGGAASGALGLGVPLVGYGAQKLLNAQATNKVIKDAIKNAPSTKDSKAAAKSLYKQVDDAGVTLLPKELDAFRRGLKEELLDSGLDLGKRSGTPKSASAMDAFDEVTSGGPIPFRELKRIRSKAGTAAIGGDTLTDKALGTKFIKEFDGYIANIDKTKVSKGDYELIKTTLPKAREAYARFAKMRTLDDIVEGSQNYTNGTTSGIRNQLVSLLKNKKASSGFTNAEKVMMRKIINGNIPTQLVRQLGNGLGKIATVGGGYATGGATGALGGMALSAGASKLDEVLTLKNVDKIKRIIASGGMKEIPQVGGNAVSLIEKALRRGAMVAPQY